MDSRLDVRTLGPVSAGAGYGSCCLNRGPDQARAGGARTKPVRASAMNCRTRGCGWSREKEWSVTRGWPPPTFAATMCRNRCTRKQRFVTCSEIPGRLAVWQRMQCPAATTISARAVAATRSVGQKPVPRAVPLLSGLNFFTELGIHLGWLPSPKGIAAPMRLSAGRHSRSFNWNSGSRLPSFPSDFIVHRNSIVAVC